MKDAKPIKTPMMTNGHLDVNIRGKYVYQKEYQSMRGFYSIYVHLDQILSLVFVCVQDLKPTLMNAILGSLRKS
jgi:hypothetical protein